MQLDIVIPVLNEEESLASIIERCLAARERLLAETELTEVTVTVVNDGSTDRSAAIAAGYEPAITVVTHPHNLGYGAAIRNGFAAQQGELVSFLDADGTCDPLFFVPLVQTLCDEELSLISGSRMGPDSQMPPIRRLGNRLFRWLLNSLAGTNIQDTASGMRVIRRDVLPLLEPLPDGLDYTPTMTCRAVFDARLRLGELPMTYAERQGRSKLSVLRDGLRFLNAIGDMTLTYQPLRLVALPGLALIVTALLLGLPLVVHYLRFQRVEEGFIYRVMMITVLGGAGTALLGSGVISELTVGLIHPRRQRFRLAEWVERHLRQAHVALASVVLALAGAALLAGPFYQRLTTGHVPQHWSQIALGSLALLLGSQAFAWLLMLRLVRLLKVAQRARES